MQTPRLYVLPPGHTQVHWSPQLRSLEHVLERHILHSALDGAVAQPVAKAARNTATLITSLIGVRTQSVRRVALTFIGRTALVLEAFEFATFMRMAEGLVFDVMMEGKSKDVSLLKLRPDLLRFAPDVAARFGIRAEDAEALARDEAALEQGVAAEEEPDVDEGVQREAAE